MKRRIVILAEKKLGPLTSKMANGVIRYLEKEVVAVIDSKNAGKTAKDVLGFGGDIPIYDSLEESMRHDPNTLVIGISPPGGKFPSDWYSLIISAIQNRLHIVSGLHDFLTDIAEFRVLADKYHVRIKDLRKYDRPGKIARGLSRKFKSKIILTVGTHGNVGKMTTTLELVKHLQKAGKSADWLATGQIGMLIKGKGIPVDTIKGDFISGAVEYALASIDGNFEYIFVEGQGSLQHLGYSAAAVGIMHGCLPDAMIMCHRSDIGVSDYGVDTDNVERMIKINQDMLAFVKPAPVVGVAVNTYNLNNEKAAALISDLTKQTRLPVNDPVRYGVENLTSAILEHFKQNKKRRIR